MQQENSSNVPIKANKMSQTEWLEKVINQLEEFKNQVSKGIIILEEGYFDKSLNLPEIDVLRTNELKLSNDYTEVE